MSMLRLGVSCAGQQQWRLSMHEKKRAQFLEDVAEAARQKRRRPRGRPTPQNLTEEGRRVGLGAMRMAPKCRTRRLNGERCRNPAMKGSTRCLKHGGRVEVPAHPHNIRRFFSNAMSESVEDQAYTRSREAWDQMNWREKLDFVSMLPPDIAKRPRLVIHAAAVWREVQHEGYQAWARLLKDLLAKGGDRRFNPTSSRNP